MSQVVLVSMPFADLQRPSLGLGILKSALREAEIVATVINANLGFAEETGLAKYQIVANSPAHLLLGDWVFQGAAFPESMRDSSEYYELIGINPDVQNQVEHCRACAPAFADALCDGILQDEPHIVGCSSTFQQMNASLALLRRIKERSPKVITVLGGANCTGDAAEAILAECPWLDIVFSGEGDTIFPLICRDIIAGVELSTLIYDGTYTQARLPQNAVTIVPDLNSVPVPDFSDYFLDLGSMSYGRYITPELMLEASRGCWWGHKHKCTFCGFFTGDRSGFRQKTSQRIQKEVCEAVETYGTRYIFMADNILANDAHSTFLHSSSRCFDKARFFFEVKANLSREQVESIAEAGVRVIQPGMESLHDGVLQLLSKGCRTYHNVRLLKYAKENGLDCPWNLLVGAPGEKESWIAEMAELIPQLVHLEPPSGAYKIQMLRSSPFHQRAVSTNIPLDPAPAYRFAHPFSEENLKKYAYFLTNDDQWRYQERIPGEAYGRLYAEVDRWIFLHQRPKTPQLCFVDDAWSAVHDARDPEASRHIVLSDIERVILRLCSDGKLLQRSSFWEELEFRIATHRLLSQRILFENNGWYLSLVPEKISTRCSKMGGVDLPGYVSERYDQLVAAGEFVDLLKF